MKRLLGSFLLLLAITLSAQAHFVFLLPSDGTRNVQVVFSDELKPDNSDLLKKITHTKFTALIDGESVPLKAVMGKDTLEFAPTGKAATWVVGVCPYGVITKGKDPFLLTYYARLVGAKPGTASATKLDAMKLDIVPMLDGKDGPTAQVLWDKKPLAAAEVVLYVPGKDESVTTKTDADGMVKLTAAVKAGLYGIRASRIEEAKGKHDGKEYTSTRSYATCVFPMTPAARSSASGSGRVFVADKPAENPEATKLLADARAARANWDHFPGFSADLKVNIEGKVTGGKLKVTDKGKVEVEMEGEAKEWAKRMLSSMVGHRMDDTTTLTTPCGFADEVTAHPLGRAIRVLNDEFHSSYRIRDRQVIEVNRKMGDARFTITVLANRHNAEKKYLPGHYVVNTWDAKTGDLRTSVAHHNTWKRVGNFDLPVTATVVTASAGKQETRKIELSGWKLLQK